MQNDLIENLEFKICLKVSEGISETLQSILTNSFYDTENKKTILKEILQKISTRYFRSLLGYLII